MPLETATTINQLVVTNPLGSDPVANADDHIRLIKATLKNTFPNITSPVTAGSDYLDKVHVPKGIITMWYGSTGNIPAGWFLCNGYNETPNLTDRFVVAAGGRYAPGATGGVETATTNVVALATGFTGSHSHAGATTATALTVAQMPSHTHQVGEGAVMAGDKYNFLGYASGDDYTSSAAGYSTSLATGGNEGHLHSIYADGGHTHSIDSHSHTVDTRSPYVALCYIMKG